MLSRRGIRIKVMKNLYSVSRDETLDLRQTKAAYNKSIQDTYDLFLFCTYSLVKICRFSEEDSEKRKTKYLPTEVDKKFTSKLYRNPIIQSLEGNKVFGNIADKKNFAVKASNDFAQNIYNEFLKEEAYVNYILSDSTSIQDHLELLLELFRFCRKNEFFNDVMEEQFINWIDDKSLVVGTIKKVLKSLPAEGNIFDEHKPDPEIVEEFGLELLQAVFEEDDELLEMIKPVLENWDHERLAIIDMISIKMAMMEFLRFETIPVKVSLNEYVEISKIYSTPKSKEFVNGILDKLLKKLIAEGKVNKVGRGLLE